MSPQTDAEARFRELIELIVRLRSPGGCPWDRTQTEGDIARCLIEEAHEVLEAIEEASPDHLREELGDLLFQILFLARLAEERGQFDVAGVLAAIIEKMVRRHPHVFAGARADAVGDVLANWERIKQGEKRGKAASPRFDGIPRSLPSLARAQRITERAAKAGFDWPDSAAVLFKLEEELAEFRAALAANDPEAIRDEAGDLLLTLVNLCRFAGVDAEAALRLSLRKFTDRFSAIEQTLAARGKTPETSSQAEMDRIWDEAKTTEGSSRNR